jgi:hypothetical protein
VLHALCNAHHLRELKALVGIEKEEWARKMQRLLRRACHITNRARERGVPLKPRLIECFERRYDAILAEGLAFHETQLPLVRAVIKEGGKRCGRAPRRTGHNLLLRLAKHKEDTLRFLRYPTVPFTNNQAERDVSARVFDFNADNLAAAEQRAKLWLRSVARVDLTFTLHAPLHAARSSRVIGRSASSRVPASRALIWSGSIRHGLAPSDSGAESASSLDTADGAPFAVPGLCLNTRSRPGPTPARRPT